MTQPNSSGSTRWVRRRQGRWPFANRWPRWPFYAWLCWLGIAQNVPPLLLRQLAGGLPEDQSPGQDHQGRAQPGIAMFGDGEQVLRLNRWR
jgi:hypothetical protein